MKEKVSSFPKARRSACADASLRAEMARVAKMSREERARAALTMRDKFPGLPYTPKPQ